MPPSRDIIANTAVGGHFLCYVQQHPPIWAGFCSGKKHCIREIWRGI